MRFNIVLSVVWFAISILQLSVHHTWLGVMDMFIAMLWVACAFSKYKSQKNQLKKSLELSDFKTPLNHVVLDYEKEMDFFKHN